MPKRKIAFCAGAEDPGTVRQFNELIDAANGLYGVTFSDGVSNDWWARTILDKNKLKHWILQCRTQVNGQSKWRTYLAIDSNGVIRTPAAAITFNADMPSLGLEPQ